MSTLPDGRYVDDAPYNPDEEALHLDHPELDAPGWVLIWRRFKKHKLGLISGVFLLLSYLLLPFVGFIAPYTCLLYTSPSPRDGLLSRMPSSA